MIVALWVLFLPADAPAERLRDLDTYYATTPFMREEILLYLARARRGLPGHLPADPGLGCAPRAWTPGCAGA